MIELDNVEPGANNLVYFIPEPDGVTVSIVIDSCTHRVKWDKSTAIDKLADLAQFITEIKE